MMETDTPETRDEWLMDTDQINRIERKLDKLLGIWAEFEPLIRKAAEFQNMSASEKVKAVLKRGAS